MLCTHVIGRRKGIPIRTCSRVATDNQYCWQHASIVARQVNIPDNGEGQNQSQADDLCAANEVEFFKHQWGLDVDGCNEFRTVGLKKNKKVRFPQSIRLTSTTGGTLTLAYVHGTRVLGGGFGVVVPYESLYMGAVLNLMLKYHSDGKEVDVVNAVRMLECGAGKLPALVVDMEHHRVVSVECHQGEVRRTRPSKLTIMPKYDCDLRTWLQQRHRGWQQRKTLAQQPQQLTRLQLASTPLPHHFRSAGRSTTRTSRNPQS